MPTGALWVPRIAESFDCKQYTDSQVKLFRRGACQSGTEMPNRWHGSSNAMSCIFRRTTSPAPPRIRTRIRDAERISQSCSVSGCGIQCAYSPRWRVWCILGRAAALSSCAARRPARVACRFADSPCCPGTNGRKPADAGQLTAPSEPAGGDRVPRGERVSVVSAPCGRLHSPQNFPAKNGIRQQ